MARERLVVIGNGMAGLRFVERVRVHAPDRFDVTVVGAEPSPAYNRVLLSSLLAQEVDEDACRFRDRRWYLQEGVRLITGAPATGIDLEEREVCVGDLTLLPFDRLVLATGSTPIRLPKPGMDLPGVVTFRDLADEAVRLADGRVLPADLVVVAVGVRPAADLARTVGINVQRGIVVDDGLETSAPGVYAIGECAEHRGIAYGLVEPAYEQADILARRLGRAKAIYEGSVLATSLKVSGVPVFSAGDVHDDDNTIVFTDPGTGAYRKLVVRNDRLAGALLIGDVAEGPWYLDLIRSRAPIGAFRHQLMFGRAYAERLAA